jgi:hypothetical protein
LFKMPKFRPQTPLLSQDSIAFQYDLLREYLDLSTHMTGCYLVLAWSIVQVNFAQDPSNGCIGSSRIPFVCLQTPVSVF